MRSLRLASLVLTSLAPSVFAVGQYLDKGQNGLGLSGTLLFAEEESQFGAGLGYSFGGMFDVSASYSRASVETESDPGAGIPSLEYGGNLFAFSLLAHPVKQTAAIPLGFSLEGGFLHGSYGGGDLEDFDIDASLNVFSVGGILHRTQALGPSFSILAGAGFGWAHASIEIGDTEDDDSRTSIPLVLEGIVGLQGGAKLVLGPTLTFNEDTNVFGLGAMFIKVF